MRRPVKGTLLAAATALVIAAAPATPASAAASGSETLSGLIVFAAVPATNTRTVVSSVVRATGVFKGVGRFVELPHVPTDPADVARDDLVFPGGTMHVLSTLGSLLSFSVNPHNCLFTGTQQLTLDVTGGTGQFADATGSFTGTVSALALLVRDPDGSCSFTQVPSHEVDKLAESGTLSF
jgi:hypothetical protein